MEVYVESNISNVIYRGYNASRFYAGLVQRPKVDKTKVGCKPKIITNFTKNLCIIDEHFQHDLKVNLNESIKYEALFYFGSTIEKDNLAKNISYQINITNSSGSLIESKNGTINGNISLTIGPFTKEGIYNVTILFQEIDPATILESFNVSVEKLNVTIIKPNDLEIFDVDKWILINGNVTKDNKPVKDANISIFSNDSMQYVCENQYKTFENGSFSCKVKFSELGNFTLTVKAIDEHCIEGETNLTLQIKDLKLSTDYSPKSPTNESTIEVKVTISVLPENKGVDAANVTFKFSGACEGSYSQSKSSSVFYQSVKPKRGDDYCDVYIEATAYNGKLEEDTSLSIYVAESEKPTPSLKAFITIIDFPSKIYVKRGGKNSTQAIISTEGSSITQNISFEIEGLPEDWYEINPKNDLVPPDPSYKVNVSFSIPLNASLGEYTAKFKATGTYAQDEKTFILVVFGAVNETNITENITETAILFVKEYLTKLETYNETIERLYNESYNVTTLRKILNEMKSLLLQLNSSLYTGNESLITQLMEEIKNKEIEFSNALRTIEKIEEKEEKIPTGFAVDIKLIGIVAAIIFVSFTIFYFRNVISEKIWELELYLRRGGFNPKKKKYIWKPLPSEEKKWKILRKRIEKMMKKRT